LFKISDKVVFRGTIAIPQPFHITFVKGKEFHGDLEFLVEEYNCAPFREQ
jgi:hypothetical protein